MGRRAQGWTLRPQPGSPYLFVRFTVPGSKPPRRLERSTGCRKSDKAKAAREAAKIYALEVYGGGATPGSVTKNDRELATDVEEWVEYFVDSHKKHPKTRQNVTSYGAEWIRAFGNSYELIAHEQVKKWDVDRCGRVTRTMHRKERNMLQVFLRWANAKGYVVGITLEPLQKTLRGKRVTTQKEEGIAVSPEKMEAFLEAMPMRTHGGGGNRAIRVRHGAHELPLSAWARVFDIPFGTLYWRVVEHGDSFRDAIAGRTPNEAVLAEESAKGLVVRPFFHVLYDTGLRPITVMRLAVNRHWKPGSDHLVITKDIDKKEYGRKVPLTPRARAALAYACPAAGPIFGVHDYKKQVERAKIAARLPAAFTIYDVRHSRGTALARTGKLLGAAVALGHKDLSSLSIYSHGGYDDAQEAISATPTGTNAIEYGGNSGVKTSRAKKGKKP